MTDGYYDSKMDIWGYGCVLFEMVSKYPLFNGSSELDQIHRINKIIGPPSPELVNRFKSKATHMKPNDWNFPTKKGQIHDPGQCFFGLGSGNSARNRPDPDQWFLWVWIRKKSDSDWIQINGFLIGLDPKKIDRFDRIQINGS